MATTCTFHRLIEDGDGRAVNRALRAYGGIVKHRQGLFFSGRSEFYQYLYLKRTNGYMWIARPDAQPSKGCLWFQISCDFEQKGVDSDRLQVKFDSRGCHVTPV